MGFKHKFKFRKKKRPSVSSQSPIRFKLVSTKPVMMAVIDRNVGPQNKIHWFLYEYHYTPGYKQNVPFFFDLNLKFKAEIWMEGRPEINKNIISNKKYLLVCFLYTVFRNRHFGGYSLFLRGSKGSMKKLWRRMGVPPKRRFRKTIKTITSN